VFAGFDEQSAAFGNFAFAAAHGLFIKAFFGPVCADFASFDAEIGQLYILLRH
jgi:hypothetical protein